ncbi:chromosome partitioning protein ParA [Paenibacillus glucanolyticus]|uniref:AAA domain-containing protein n=1 Tax=Paenibacillus glucanolyticus TaxID=59843 RepID=A0A163GNF8_9BACL|nr:hypothetical protein [Paenibacillus glucanolyticus]KZS45061.1 hypothetical protein AWU65_03505 [Paenibacillus glucanolyticus]OMF64130.1 hypothetical protein BK142_32215 [Paenibacillus glucanolyticus]
MATVAFWGIRDGQVATTSNLIATATNIGMNTPIKTLITHTHWRKTTLENSYKKPVDSNHLSHSFTDYGIDALERLAKSNRLTPESIRDNTTPLIKGHLDMLYGTTKPDQDFHEQLIQAVPAILRNAENYYDLTLIDVPSGVTNELTKTVLQESDLVVVCLNQNLTVLNSFFENKEYPEILNQKEHLFVLGKYDDQSKYSVKNIQRKYRLKNKIYTVPHCSSFLDATNDSNVLDFFLRNRHISSSHENSSFFAEVNKLSRAISAKLDLKLGRLESGGE